MVFIVGMYRSIFDVILPIAAFVFIISNGRNRPSARLNQATRGNGTDGDASGIWA